MPNYHAVIVTDASFCQVSHIAAYAAVISPRKGRVKHICGGFTEHICGSHDAERMAIQIAIVEARKMALTNVIVYTDCMGAIHTLVRKPECRRQVVRYQHIKAHTKSTDNISLMNQWCDRESRSFLNLMRETST